MTRTAIKDKTRKIRQTGGRRGNIKRAGWDIYEDEQRQKYQKVKPAGKKDLIWFETRWRQYQKRKTI